MPLLMVQKSGIISGKFWWWAPKVSDVSCEVNSIASTEAKIASMAVFGGTPKMPQGKELKKKSPQAREWAQIRGSLYLVRSCKYKLKKRPFIWPFFVWKKEVCNSWPSFCFKHSSREIIYPYHIYIYTHIYMYTYMYIDIVVFLIINHPTRRK